VEIHAARRNGTLEIAVRDDGAGLASDAGAGIGLGNTRERLAQLYGGAHRLELRDAPGGGLEVAIAIPFRTAREEEDGPGPRARG
jgi:signal transduction histidine kinase